MKPHVPDLTRQPPRSPRVKLGGYVILPRLLDKGRATLAGLHGEYKYACPLDQRFLEFAGISAETLLQQIQSGEGDGAILAWIQSNSTTRPSAAEIAAWSSFEEQRVPTEPAARQRFNEIHSKTAPGRTDIAGWFDLLDVDDYVSFGGVA